MASNRIFPPGTDTELAAIQGAPALPASSGLIDLRSLLWSSIDNDASKDLDPVEWAEQLPDGRIRVLIGVADVDVRVPHRQKPARRLSTALHARGSQPLRRFKNHSAHSL